MSKSKEILILAEAINTCLEAVEESSLGKVVYKLDENDLSNNPKNIAVNNIALGAFSMILKEKIQGLYQRQKN